MSSPGRKVEYYFMINDRKIVIFLVKDKDY